MRELKQRQLEVYNQRMVLMAQLDQCRSVGLTKDFVN